MKEIATYKFFKENKKKVGVHGRKINIYLGT